jgi:hypothetical protein
LPAIRRFGGSGEDAYQEGNVGYVVDRQREAAGARLTR